jgi:hypothetical protein
MLASSLPLSHTHSPVAIGSMCVSFTATVLRCGTFKELRTLLSSGFVIALLPEWVP